MGDIPDRHSRQRGWTLIELVVSVILVGAVLVVAIGIIPMGVTALRKAEDLQAATLYGLAVVEDASRKDFIPTPDKRRLDFEIKLNRSTFRVQRFIYAVDGEPPHLYDVVVRVTWDPQPAPVELKTRVFRP